MIGLEKRMLPDFPRTRYLPHKAFTIDTASIANDKDADIVFSTDQITIEEKVDGANTGMILFEGNPIIRNRNHLLNKAFIQRKTAAKMQFASIHNWFYSNVDKFEAVNEALGFEASIYGEWMFAVHGIEYMTLPDLWIPYDIYDWQGDKYLPSIISRKVLQEAGFNVPALVHEGKIKSYEQLEAFCNEKSAWSDDKREGIYIKVNNKDKLIERFKMVREGFVQGAKWSDTKIIKNRLSKL